MTDPGAYPLTYTGYYNGDSRPVRGVAPVEEMVTIHVNGKPLVSLMCTPTNLEELALGFLFNERLIEGQGQVTAVETCGERRCVDVWLDHAIEAPALRVVTSGCSGGVTFQDAAQVHQRVAQGRQITPQQVTQLIQEFAQTTTIYRRAGGVHGAALAGDEGIVCTAEDVGRHNALDKIAGICLRQGHAMPGKRLITSGRISSEMVNKAARMGLPIVISHTSPTSLSIQLAQEWNITLIGYTRRRSFRVYTGDERIRKPE